MNVHRTSPSPLGSDNICNSAPTMSDLLAFLQTTTALEAKRRRDLMSAVRRVCELTERDPAHLAADVPTLRGALRKMSGQRNQLTKKTLANIKANVLAGIRLMRDEVDVGRTRAPLPQIWKDSAHQLTDIHLQRGLSRFMGFCGRQGVAPDNVSDATMQAFDRYLRTETLIEKPNDLIRRTTRLWNEAVDQVPGWPKQKVTVPSFRTPRRTIPFDQLPQSFRRDVEAYLEWSSGRDIFAKTAPPKPCRDTTLRLRTQHIIGAATAFIESRDNDGELEGLSDLTKPEAVKVILRNYLSRTNDEPTQYHRAITTTLIQIAKYWTEEDDEDIEALKELRRRLGSDRAGLTDKNRRTLLQIEDADNLARLLLLPHKLFTHAARQPSDDTRAAVQAQIALAIEILLMAPMRMGNLSKLRIDQHVTRYTDHIHLVLPGSETKNGEETVYPICGESKELFDLYLKRYRPRLAAEDCVWLFPTVRGTQKTQATLSHQINKTIRDKTGLQITPHQFRHLAAKLLLDSQPGNYEAARQLLTHKSLSSTTSFYAELQTKNAAREYDSMLHEKRQNLIESSGTRGRKLR